MVSIGGGAAGKLCQWIQSESLGVPLKVLHGTGRKANTLECFPPAERSQGGEGCNRRPAQSHRGVELTVKGLRLKVSENNNTER